MSFLVFLLISQLWVIKAVNGRIACFVWAAFWMLAAMVAGMARL